MSKDDDSKWPPEGMVLEIGPDYPEPSPECINSMLDSEGFLTGTLAVNDSGDVYNHHEGRRKKTADSQLVKPFINSKGHLLGSVRHYGHDGEGNPVFIDKPFRELARISTAAKDGGYIPPDKQVDHKNINPLDNSSANLHAVTQSENMHNQGPRNSRMTDDEARALWNDICHFPERTTAEHAKNHNRHYRVVQQLKNGYTYTHITNKPS